MAVLLPGRPAGSDLIGYSGLIEAYALRCAVPRRLVAIMSVAHAITERRDGTEWLILPRGRSIRLPATPIAHLTVALRHEALDLRVLDCLFHCDIQDDLCRLINANRAGIYTRRAWFLYEWITGTRLPIDEPYGAAYALAIDPTQYFTIPPTRSTRHKIDNNLPGVPGFCPLIRRTERLAGHRTATLAAEAKTVLAGADPAVLRRAVGYMLLNESKGSFGIEGETPPRTRLERWGALIADASNIALSVPALETLHRSLFDQKHAFTAFGLRQDGGFVGRHDPRDQTPLPDHISARPEDVRPLIEAMLQTYALLRQHAFDPVLTAAVLGFGFVFIHPFEDGNGRLHRFLIQKALVDLGFNPPGVVLPLSAAILDDLAGYRATLEDFSLAALPAIEWEPTGAGNVRVTNDTAYLYRYFDATRQAEYLLDKLEHTIRVALPQELRFLQRFDDAKRRIGAEADLPDRLVSLFIQFCVQNGGILSARKRAEYFPALPDDIVAALQAATRASGVLDVTV